MSSSALWNKSNSQNPIVRKATDWKEVIPKSSTLQDIMTKVINNKIIRYYIKQFEIEIVYFK